MRRTRIVCTIGPATASPEALQGLLRAGMDVARLNFSHGDHATHRAVIGHLRAASAACDLPVAILQDLCGPKLRVGEMAPDTVLHVGERFTLTSGTVVGDAERASVSHPHLARDVQPGSRVLIDDGLLELRVEEISDADVRCRVVVGGALSSRKGVNFPGVALTIPSVTEKDWADLDFGLDEGVDFVALSFVRHADDVRAVKARIAARGLDTPVLVKIEKFEALERLESIIEAADGAMVARGDLGVETSYECVPLEQKRIIALCRKHARPVITATQMLDSMIRNPRPTRAEAADVANAVLDGTDAVMLSGETATGRWPFEAVAAMGRIVSVAEEALPFAELVRAAPLGTTAAHALSLAACESAELLGAAAIVACTASGDTARRISQLRPRAPILAVTPSVQLTRRLRLCWGVVPMQAAETTHTDALLAQAREAALRSGFVQAGDLTVITATLHGASGVESPMLVFDVARDPS